MRDGSRAGISNKATLLAIMLVLMVIPGRVAATSTTGTQALPGGAVDPPGGASPIVEYSILLHNAGPLSIAEDQNGDIWAAEFTGGALAEFFPANQTFRQLPIPETNALPTYVTVAPSGLVWFSDQEGTGSIWSYDPATNEFSGFPIPTHASNPVGVLVDPDKNVWFAEDSGNKVGELVYPSYALVEYPLPQPGSGPAELAMKGSALWVTESIGDRIALFNTTTHAFHEYVPAVPFGSPVGIVLDQEGNVWISEHGGSSIVRLNPSTGVFTKYPTSPPPPALGFANSAPATLVIDKQGRLWFVEHFSNRVGRFDPATGRMDEFAIPSTGVYSVQSLIDSNGNFWFTEFSGDKIGTISGNAQVQIAVTLTSAPSGSLNPGQQGQAVFDIANTGNKTQTYSLGVTATFSQTGETNGAEASLDSALLTLNPGQSAPVVAYITAPSGTPGGLYSVGVSAVQGNISTVGIATVTVAPDQLGVLVSQVLPDVLTVAIISLLVGNFFVWAGREKRSATARTWTSAWCITVIALLSIVLSSVLTPAAEAKCPGLPGLGSSSAGPDYVTYIVLSVQIAILAILAYFFVLGILGRRRRGSRQESAQEASGEAGHESGQTAAAMQSFNRAGGAKCIGG